MPIHLPPDPAGRRGARIVVVAQCILLTLIATCRLIKVDPYRYLDWAMTRVVAHPTNRGLVPSDLTPAAYKSAQEGDAQ